LVHIVLRLECESNETVFLQLPSWRPGRYELANYAQYIKDIKAFSENIPVDLKKTSKDCWTFQSIENGIYEIHYTYFAGQMDAGGSWLDPSQVYLNFINFAFEIKGKEASPITIELDLPNDYEVATALPRAVKNLFQANNFQHLVDSPLMASAALSHETYTVKGSRFHIWIHGEVHFDLNALVHDFNNFTLAQVNAFGECPAGEFHFLIQLLPYPHYHGVEHQFSTVITLGPAKSLEKESHMDKLMGVCSHELYHLWNVCRIRPKALLPYDFSKEAYIQEGMVAEGVTTYMGHLQLLLSGYYGLTKYLKILEKMFCREFESFGWKNQSIVASSWDLWLDGYKLGIPDKKVSIYNRGALLSLCLDLILFEKGSRLQQVMNALWQNYGKKEIGYQLEDFEREVLKISGDDPKITLFFENYVWGNGDILPELRQLLLQIGIEVAVAPRKNSIESNYGIIHDPKGKILKIHPDSPAYRELMVGDTIQFFALDKEGLKLEFLRMEKIVTAVLKKTHSIYFQNYELNAENENHKLEEFIKQ